MAQKADIQALVALISNAAKVVEEHYAKTEKPWIPDLGDLEEHPLDAGPSDGELRNAIQIIEGASGQLAATVARPSHTVCNKLMSFHEATCLNVVLTFKVADIIAESPSGMHISEIGKRAGVHERKLGRILRLLASKHVFTEVSENVFANNRLSIQLLSTNPLSSLGLHFTEDVMQSSVLLSETLADPIFGPSDAAIHTPFNKWSKTPEPVFIFYEGATPKGAELGARFGIGMIGWGGTIEASSVIHQFPWKSLGDGASVCDIGGGIGNISMQLAKAYPQLQVKLQDLPGRIQQAKNEVWPERCPEAIAENRIEFKPIDFLAESPIPSCDAYFMKNIIHDWPDADCVKIFSHIRKVMKPTSRILVHEYILERAYRLPDDQSQGDQFEAPKPLLPNYGVGRIRQYNLDLGMMTMLNSPERSLSDFIRLGNEAGLKFEKLWDCGDMGLVEYRLPESVA